MCAACPAVCLLAGGWAEAGADADAAAPLEAAGLLGGGGELLGLGAGQPHAAGANWDHWAGERQHHH